MATAWLWYSPSDGSNGGTVAPWDYCRGVGFLVQLRCRCSTPGGTSAPRGVATTWFRYCPSRKRWKFLFVSKLRSRGSCEDLWVLFGRNILFFSILRVVHTQRRICIVVIATIYAFLGDLFLPGYSFSTFFAEVRAGTVHTSRGISRTSTVTMIPFRAS